MKSIYRFVMLAVLVFVLIAVPSTNNVPSVRAAGTPCVNYSDPLATYTVMLCITSPVDGATFMGDGQITAAVTAVTGINPGVRRMVYYLNNVYTLTDYSDPFTFTLPTNRWVDGTYTLSVEAILKDGNTTTPRANIQITFTTGTGTPPVNGATFVPTSGTTPASGQPFIVAATGDGAGGEANAASVTNVISAINPNLFLYLGDVYEKGSIAEYYNWYEPTTYFGRFRSITDPTVGNHDYGMGTTLSPDSSAYRYFWNNVPDYYSFDAGGWHFISMNSFSQYVDVGPTSAEYLWLQSDLADNPNPCTIAFYHHPYLSIGQEGGRADISDIWSLLAQNKVDIVLNGHDHEYQRWQPLNGSGQLNTQGVTEFVLGGGGHSLQPLTTTDARVAYATDANPLGYGALKLALYPTYAVFSYMSITGATVDTGIIPCKDASVPALNSIFFPLITK